MSSKGRNASLRNSMHRHPQMSEKSVYFAGQDENSSNTFLRWLGSEWEETHTGNYNISEHLLPYNRKYLPVGLANGAAGNHPGFGCKWDLAGGSAEYTKLNGDPIEYSSTEDPFDEGSSSTETINRGISGEFPLEYETGSNNDGRIDYKEYDMPSEVGITYSNAYYNNSIPNEGRETRFDWPLGEYRPVFADARPHKLDDHDIPYGGDGVTSHGSLWRMNDSHSAAYSSFFHLPVHYNIFNLYHRDASGAEIDDMKLMNDYAPMQFNQDTNVAYEVEGDVIADYTDWTDANKDLGKHPISVETNSNGHFPKIEKNGNIRFKVQPMATAQERDGFSDTRETLCAAFGFDPSRLNEVRLWINIKLENGSDAGQWWCWLEDVKFSSTEFWWLHEDVHPNTISGTEPWPTSANGWSCCGAPMGTSPWGAYPSIKIWCQHVGSPSDASWTHHPPNDNLLVWKKEQTQSVGNYLGVGRITRSDAYADINHYQKGISGGGRYTDPTEIRTPTRSVLLYDLAGAIPAGAPLMKAELFLTSKGRWNWPNEDISEHWSDNPIALAGPTGPRRLKVGKGPQYQLSQLHPSTTKEATWGTYDGNNPWTDLIGDGTTCSIMPNVFNMGSSSGSNNTNNIQWGMGWAFDTGGYDEVSMAKNWSLKEWMSFEKEGLTDDEPKSEFWWQQLAVQGPNREEHRGITGGGVLLISPELATDNNTANVDFSQNEIYELTGRRARDVIDFDISNDAGSTTCIDVTAYARDAIYNMGGKLRLAVTGKTITGTPNSSWQAGHDPGDTYKSESSWSHYAWQYNNDYPYGGGRRDESGPITNDYPGPEPQHPYCGPHTIKTEFYSLSDDSNSQVFEDGLSFKNTLDTSGSGIYGNVINLTDLIVRWQDLMNSPELAGATWRWLRLYNRGNDDNNPGEFMIYFNFLANSANAPLLSSPTGQLLEQWADDAHAMADILNGPEFEDTVVKLVCPAIVGSNTPIETVTIGEDVTGTDSESIGYKLDDGYRTGRGFSTSGNPDAVTHCFFWIKFQHPQQYAEGGIPADGKTMLRHYDTGENYYGLDYASGYFSGYFLGDGGTILATLGAESTWASSLEIKSNEVSPDSGKDYICSDMHPFPVSQVGDIFGITHSIPSSDPIDNRGIYSVKNIIEPNIIEVNENITPQVINNSSGDYGTITATNFMNRPYLKLTYSEQEAYGV